MLGSELTECGWGLPGLCSHGLTDSCSPCSPRSLNGGSLTDAHKGMEPFWESRGLPNNLSEELTALTLHVDNTQAT